MTTSGATYAYEFEDRLASTSSGVQIIYDGDGNRVSETVGGVTTMYLVDDHNPTGYAQVAEEIVSGVVTVQYTHGLLRISQNRSGAVSYYGYDGGDSVRQLFDATGSTTDAYVYDAFGNTVARTGTTANSYQYRGEQLDSSLGMYYLRARYYVSSTGRFLTEDKRESDQDLASSSNLYLFADADGVNRSDPSGFGAIIDFATLSQPIFKNNLWTGANLNDVSLGRVAGGAPTAWSTLCVLDKTWSILDLANQASGGQHDTTLDAITIICKAWGCCGACSNPPWPPYILAPVGGGIHVAPQPLEPGSALDNMLTCMSGRLCQQLLVTSTGEPTPQHRPNDPHMHEAAVDINFPRGGNATPVLQAAGACGAIVGHDESRERGHIHIELPAPHNSNPSYNQIPKGPFCSM